MHILKIIHGFPPEYNAGSEVYSQSIVNELAKNNKLTVFTREENEYELDFRFREETKGDVDFVYVNMARGKDGYNHEMLNERFAEMLERINPDIAHIGHLNHLSIGIVKELKKRNVPIFFTLHDFWLMCPRGQFLQRNFDGNNLYKLCDKQENHICASACYKMYQSGVSTSIKNEQYNSKDDDTQWTNWIGTRMSAVKQLLPLIDLFHAPSRYLMDRFINDFGIPKDKIIYLDYGFPTHYLRPVIPKTNGIYTFGYIGTHIPSKGIDMLIKAFKRIKAPAKLKIYGRESGQSTKALRKLAEGCDNTIEFCGEYINSNLANHVFQYINAIVVPSIWAENSPLVIHEAQSCKIPVITADYGGMKEYVHHKENGLLFNHRDVDSLFEQLNYAVQNREEMKEYGKRAYLFSSDGSIPDIMDHCDELMKNYNFLIQKNEK